MGEITTTSAGRQAEALAAAYLAKQGYRILARNWRTRTCEIDLVAVRGQRYHFVEVKYRRSFGSGSGFEHITMAKQKQLRRAALTWIATYNPAAEYQIDAIQVTGDLEAAIIDFLPNAVTD